MTAGKNQSGQSYSAGEWGRNRVRIFPDPRTGLIQIEWREEGRRLTRSLRHRDWAKAKRQADEFAASCVQLQLQVQAEVEPGPLTLGRLLDLYGEEVTPAKGEGSRKYDGVAMKMFLRFLGKDRNPRTLSKRDWDRFIRERRAGRVGPSRKPVSDRTIERDLKFLLAVLNWAAQSRDEQGELLLESNPLRGLKPPTEKNPTRVFLTEAEYEALLRVSLDLDWRFHVALVLAHETGHRIGAIRQLRWSDVDLDGRVIRWRAEHEKTGYEHLTPMTAEALAALAEARTQNPGAADAPVLPAPKDPSRSVSHTLAGAVGGRRRRGSRDWSRSVAEAGIPSGGSSRRTSWTSRSRCFANSAVGRRHAQSSSATSG